VTTNRADVRPAALAGQWYPGKAQPLRDAVELALRHATPPSISGHVVGLMVPHAGYRFSAGVAAHAFAWVAGMQVDTVVVIGPLHQAIPGVQGGVLTSGHSAYHTPLGALRVDHEALARLAALLPLTYCTNDPEHSIEIELPFLQVVLPAGFTLLPIMLREQTANVAQQLSAALTTVLSTRRVLYVASSDLSHFYPQALAQMFDRKVLAAVAQLAADEVIGLEARHEAFACGRGAIATTIHASCAAGATHAAILNYATSGDLNGDHTRVVGYGAAAFYHLGA
jgi:MEMO1 family protein